MKITKVRATLTALPADEPLANMPNNPGGTRLVVACEIDTDEGVNGIAVTLLANGMMPTVRVAVEQLGAVITGMDPLRIGAINQKMWEFGNNSGPSGIVMMALSAIDVALWDIKGKALNQPVWKLLGGTRDKVPTYASGALMRELTHDQCAKSARTLVEKGFFQMKTQLALPGDTSPSKELERARVVREAIGPDVSLMCDINQRWRPEQAIQMGHRLEDINFFWLEDVTIADDYAGLARVADALYTPVAGGEYVYGLPPLRCMLEARSVDILMVDPFRVGGFTGWMKAAGMAEAFNVPIVSHLVPEIMMHAVAAAPNGLTVEYMPWIHHLYEEVTWPKDGMLTLPSAPGLGLKFDQAALKKYAVS
jgi:L-alanine-DL-glutamate epimerase-like enolase superfamily enzyme